MEARRAWSTEAAPCLCSRVQLLRTTESFVVLGCARRSGEEAEVQAGPRGAGEKRKKEEDGALINIRHQESGLGKNLAEEIE